MTKPDCVVKARKRIKFYWRIILANAVVCVLNVAIIITIPLGLWRGLEPNQFLTILIATDAVAWCAAFAWFTYRPIDLGLD